MSRYFAMQNNEFLTVFAKFFALHLFIRSLTWFLAQKTLQKLDRFCGIPNNKNQNFNILFFMTFAI